MTIHVRWVQKKGRSQRWIEYQIRGRYPDGEDYEERRKSPRSTISATERYAEEREKILHETWQKQRNEEFKAPPLGTLWGEYLTYCRTVKRNMPSTLKWKGKVYKLHLLPHLGETLRVDKIDDDRIEKLTAALGKLQPKTVNLALGLLHSALAYAERKKMIVRVPHIDMLKVEKRAPKRLVLEDYAALVRACDELAAEGLWQPLVMCRLGGECGLRMQEIIALPWSDVDLVGGRIFVQRAWSEGEIVTTKGKRFRVVPIEPPMVKLLERHRHKGALVLRHDGKTQWRKTYNTRTSDQPVTPSVAYRWFFLAIARAKIAPNGRLHVLRHTFGSHLAEAGQDGHRIKSLLGHANLSTTEIYTELSAGSTRAATRALAEYREKSIH